MHESLMIKTGSSGGTVGVDGDQFYRDNHQGGEAQLSGEVAVSTDVITQARTPSGFPRTGASITENDIINLKGSEGRIKDMIAAGLVEGLPDGSYRVTSNQPSQEKPEGTQESLELQQESLGDDIEASITEIAQGANQGDVLSFISTFANNAGEINETAMGRIASSMSMEPEAARDQAATITAAFEAQAHATIEQATGMDSQDVINWAHENEPELMKKAMMQQATQRNTHGYQEIATKYVSNLDTANPDMILNADFGEGVEAYKKGKDIIIRHPKGETNWKTAVRAGIIKVGSR
ncbi:conserved hypothetical protein [Candidatus Terasakiella magnetica]|uniref:Uncharacterized protein n=1 Tax=Candidatus Terasakiella magnetica TaxID=1867952 RepID=A0A1C3RC37_9PROT|nr:hypothetical protein [Candidatus Terasakiella magnetica]SCA54831.1 conserved hypothetical protein [Candidatus Terasakiella magnetica]